jgi:exodeoxyribonuclease VII large subunit
VAIIRGGGGTVGLSCYNNYQLAKETALFPIPVLTGIGHAGNETLVEMIAHSNAITPSKLAEYLIQKFHNISVPVKEAEKNIAKNTRHYLMDIKKTFYSEVKMLRSSSEKNIVMHHHAIRKLSYPLIQNARFFFRKEADSLSLIKKTLDSSLKNMLVRAHEKSEGIALHMMRDIKNLLGHNKYLLSRLSENIESYSRIRLKNMKIHMDNIAQNLDNMDPQNILKRGYSITICKGKPLKNVSETSRGDTLKTHLFNGEIISIVDSIKKTRK